MEYTDCDMQAARVRRMGGYIGRMASKTSSFGAGPIGNIRKALAEENGTIRQGIAGLKQQNGEG